MSSPREWQCLCSIMCPAFSQPAFVAFFSCPIIFVSIATYSALGQLSDAHWPNSARLSLNSLGRGNIGKAAPLHCSCSWANVCGFSEGAFVTTEAQAVIQFNILLVSCIVTIWKLHSFKSSFLHCILPQTSFFACVKYKIKLKRTKNTDTHSKSIWSTVVLFLLPLIISFISSVVDMVEI